MEEQVNNPEQEKIQAEIFQEVSNLKKKLKGYSKNQLIEMLIEQSLINIDLRQMVMHLQSGNAETPAGQVGE